MATRSIGFDIFAKDRASSVFDKVGASAEGVEKKFGKAGARMDKVGQIAGKALAGGLLLAGVAAVKLGQAAADDEAAAAKLSQTLHESAGATDEQVAATEAWISAQGQALGVTDDELRPAIGRLAVATGDLGKAQELAALAMDVSAGSGKSLQQVTEALQKGVNGSVVGLSRLGVATKDASGKTKSLEQITKELAATYKGAAATAAETTAGKQRRLKVSMSELGEEIGAKVLPAMVKLSEVGLKAVGWIDRNQKLVGILAGTVAGLAAVLWTASLAMRAWGVATAAASGIHAAYTAVVGLSSSTLGTFIGVKALEFSAWTRGIAVKLADTATMVANKAVHGVGWLATFIGVKGLELAAWVGGTTAKIADTAATVAHTAVSTIASTATKAWAATQWLLNVALTANPIGLVVVAIGALVAALVIAWKHSDTFRKIVSGAFDKVKGAASAAFGWVKKNWPLILAILTGPIGIAVLVITKKWGDIKAGAQSVVEFVKGIPGKLKDLAGRFGDAGRALIGAFVNGMKNAAGIISGIAGNVWSAVRSLLNGAIDKINAALEFKISLPGPDVSINPPNIPHLAKGGIVTRPTLAVIGEAGPEAVVPLSGRHARGAGGNVYHIHIHGVTDKRGAARELEKVLQEYVTNEGRPLQVATL